MTQPSAPTIKAKRTPPRASQKKLLLSVAAVTILIAALFGFTLAKDYSPKLGLDLAGGLAVVYKPVGHPTKQQLDEAVTVLNSRVNALGVSGSQVATQGSNIAVSVPGVKNARAVLATIGQTAQLYFRPLLCYAPEATAATKLPQRLPQCAADAAVTAQSVTNASPGLVTPDPVFAKYKSTAPPADDPQKTVLLKGLAPQKVRYVLSPAALNGSIVASAQPALTSIGAWIVTYTLTPKGSAQWDALAKKYFHSIIGIELDGVVQSAPVIQPNQTTFSSFGGQGEITGNFTQSQAVTLAQALEFGALPVRLVPLTTQTISPTLGHSALIAGLGAGVAGLVLVMLYILFYYRKLGLVVISGLALTGLLLWAIIALLGHTTLAPSFALAGVTGLIVSIGITVDSYIVYFERLKDETRTGKSLRSSVDKSFASAWRTVLAADFVSLLAASILYLIAIGDVRGFAFFLGLSTLLDIAMTYFYTRPLVMLLGRATAPTERPARTHDSTLPSTMNTTSQAISPAATATATPTQAGDDTQKATTIATTTTDTALASTPTNTDEIQGVRKEETIKEAAPGAAQEQPQEQNQEQNAEPTAETPLTRQQRIQERARAAAIERMTKGQDS